MLRTRILPAVRFESRPGRALFGVALAVVLAIAAVKYAAKAQKPSSLGTQTRTAFLRWRPQVAELHAGVDVYRRFAYPNPPIMALVLTPFYAMPPVTGALAWFVAKAVMAALTAAWVFRLIEHGGLRVPFAAKAGAVLFALHPVLGDLSHGNVNLFIGFLVAAMLELRRRGYETAAGVTLAFAVACKVTPALFVPYFLWKRAWKCAAGCALGMVLWLFVVPGLALGWEHNITLLESWFDVMVKPFAAGGKVTSEHANQSVPGLAFRLLTREPSFVDYDEDDKPFAADFHTVADLGPDAAKWIVKGIMAIFAAGIWYCARNRSRGGLGTAAEAGAVALGMLLFSERTWKHHAVLMIVPAAVLFAVGRRWAYGLLAVAGLLMWTPSLLPEAAQDLCLVYGTYTAAFALLAGGCLAAARIARDGDAV
jgi:alpha-1,2-mannosyltransferase